MVMLERLRKQLDEKPLQEGMEALFVHTLNWGYADTHSAKLLTLSEPQWKSDHDAENLRVSARPISLAAGVPVFLVHLPEESKLPGVLGRREAFKALASDSAEHLLIFVSWDGKACQFVWARRQQGKQPEMRVLPYEQGEPARTTLEQLGELKLGESDYDNLAAVVRHLQAAFNVERLTKEFFKHYERLFKTYVSEVKPLLGRKSLDEETRKQFVQVTMNRLMFLAFLQRKGWLAFPADCSMAERRSFLFNLYQDWTRDDHSQLFHQRLAHLFFMALNEQDPTKRKHLENLAGRVPFLNGGLFEGETYERDNVNGELLAFLPNAFFEDVLGDQGLFRTFNFTITESTPLDIEVALDPEMLGKIFEELVTGRHETGSYYTPRPVVSFMCKETLKGYLGGFEGLVDRHDPDGVGIPEAKELIHKLESIKVVDPACGSGAYLIGMLQELHAIQIALDTRRRESTDPVERKDAARDDYQRKLAIIQNCLYGGDIDQFAINISYLRLWLSLVIDDPRNPLDDGTESVALPNLRFKAVRGDSLMARIGDLQLFDHEYNELSHRLRLLHEEYFKPPRPDEPRRPSTAVETDMDNAQAEIRKLIGSQASPDWLDWQVQFAEVFASGGFDVVLANPPYVRADAQFKHLLPDKKAQAEAIANWKAFRETLKKSSLYETTHEKWDLYIPFLERAHQLLRPEGHLSFIIPDAYNTAKYAAKSHEFFLRQSTIERLDFCSEIPLFRAGVFNTILHFRKSVPGPTHKPRRIRRSGDSPDEFDSGIAELPSELQAAIGVRAFRLDNSVVDTVGDFAILGHICYITKGMVIHADEREHAGEFTTDDVLSLVQDERHPRRFVLGKDLAKWVPRRVRFLEWGTSRAPGHFSRPTFEALQMAKEKILGLRTPGKNIRLLYDADALHFDASSVGFVPWHLLEGVTNRSIQKTALYAGETSRVPPRLSIPRETLEGESRQFDLKFVLGVMNSRAGAEWIEANRSHRTHVFPDDWKAFPIPRVSKADHDAIVTLVQRCIDCISTGTDAELNNIESEIDNRVEFLFRHRQDSPTYDEWLRDRQAAKGIAVAEIRQLCKRVQGRKIESQTLELKAAVVDPRGASNKVKPSVLEDIVAFLNTNDGNILIGVDDDGNFVGLESCPEQLPDGKVQAFLDKLASYVMDRVSKLAYRHVVIDEPVEIDGLTVVRLRVKGDPVAEFTADDRFFVRFGDRSQEISGIELADELAGRRARRKEVRVAQDGTAPPASSRSEESDHAGLQTVATVAAKSEVNLPDDTHGLHEQLFHPFDDFIVPLRNKRQDRAVEILLRSRVLWHKILDWPMEDGSISSENRGYLEVSDPDYDYLLEHIEELNAIYDVLCGEDPGFVVTQMDLVRRLPKESDSGPPYDGVDPWSLDWMAMKDAQSQTDSQMQKLREDGWTFSLPREDQIGDYMTKGYRLVVWKTPDGKPWKLCNGLPIQDSNVWMMRKEEGGQAH